MNSSIEDLAGFVRAGLTRNISITSLQEKLLELGFEAPLVDAALSAALGSPVPAQAETVEQTQILDQIDGAGSISLELLRTQAVVTPQVAVKAKAKPTETTPERPVLRKARPRVQPPETPIELETSAPSLATSAARRSRAPSPPRSANKPSRLSRALRRWKRRKPLSLGEAMVWIGALTLLWDPVSSCLPLFKPVLRGRFSALARIHFRSTRPSGSEGIPGSRGLASDETPTPVFTPSVEPTARATTPAPAVDAAQPLTPAPVADPQH